PRPGSARHRADQVRKRRLVLTASAVALAAAVGIGGWLALSDDSGKQPPPQDTKNSAPVVP
ncbi:serine/threonine protein kinase, partial [Streptomyces sp. SID1034]|nr:serine/threonine protein kinase [Streptomyces sp. SID1034]